ncbi:penicillin acylase family protein [Kovacikia minuta]|uniref:penicillin acylase family protein n=1 Tax=Kovacikia minuta TaxID=2931930 RepID=UPI0020C77C48|nr:penicillin acylase family protein [Kovacikia minuta]
MQVSVSGLTNVSQADTRRSILDNLNLSDLAGLSSVLQSADQALSGVRGTLRSTLNLLGLRASLNLPGLKDTIEVARDAAGIVHINAKNEDDLFFAQGFMHATDRLWQMGFPTPDCPGTVVRSGG